MGLALYDSDQLQFSSETGLSPLRSYHDGKNGSAAAHLVYIRNDSVNFFYEDVELKPVDSIGYDDTIGEYGTGFSVKLKYGTPEPLPHEWKLVPSGEAVTLPNSIGNADSADTTTYYPVWVRFNVPGNTPVQNKSDIKLRLSYIKRPVTS